MWTVCVTVGLKLSSYDTEETISYGNVADEVLVLFTPDYKTGEEL